MAGEASRQNGKLGGRPKHKTSIALEEMKLKFRKRMQAKADKIFDAWEDAALGHFVEVKTADGEIKVYKKSPNTQAIKDMIEHTWGKPETPVDLKTDGEIILKVVSYGDSDTAQLSRGTASSESFTKSSEIQSDSVASESEENDDGVKRIDPKGGIDQGSVLVHSPVLQPSEENRVAGSGDASEILSTEYLG